MVPASTGCAGRCDRHGLGRRRAPAGRALRIVRRRRRVPARDAGSALAAAVAITSLLLAVAYSAVAIRWPDASVRYLVAPMVWTSLWGIGLALEPGKVVRLNEWGLAVRIGGGGRGRDGRVRASTPRFERRARRFAVDYPRRPRHARVGSPARSVRWVAVGALGRSVPRFVGDERTCRSSSHDDGRAGRAAGAVVARRGRDRPWEGRCHGRGDRRRRVPRPARVASAAATWRDPDPRRTRGRRGYRSHELGSVGDGCCGRCDSDVGSRPEDPADRRPGGSAARRDRDGSRSARLRRGPGPSPPRRHRGRHPRGTGPRGLHRSSVPSPDDRS